MASLARAIETHPLLLMIPATLAASCAFVLPVSTPPNAIVYASGYLEPKDFLRVGLPIWVLSQVLLIVLAAVFWAVATILVKASPLCGIHAGRVLLYQLVVSAVMLPVGAVMLGQTDIANLSPLILACVAYQVIWVAFITYFLWFWLISNYPPSRLAAFTFLTPLCGVVAGGLLLGEPITSRLVLALVLVGSGI